MRGKKEINITPMPFAVLYFSERNSHFPNEPHPSAFCNIDECFGIKSNIFIPLKHQKY